MNREIFERLVDEAVKSLPQKFKRLIQNVSVIVEDRHPQSLNILGLYHGVPYKHRGPYYGNLPPDVIVIYQKPIERICSTEDEIKQKVREVVLHEIGHYFGLTEAQLRDIEES